MKVTVGLGLTLSLGRNSSEFIKPFVTLTDVDLEKDVEAQLLEAKRVLNLVWNLAQENIILRVESLIGPTPEIKETLEKASIETQTEVNNVSKRISGPSRRVRKDLV